jgi:energy-coupling factor transport system substrate-specific component
MGNSNTLSIKTIVAIGIGSALFIILGRFGAIPTGIPQTNIETAYALLALIAILYGPVAGLLVGLIGHTLKDMIFYGSPWFSWVLASAIVGLIIGLAARKFKIHEGEFNNSDIVRFNIFQIIANALAWFVIAPVLDILFYAEPVDKVFVQGLVAGVANIVTVLVLGTLLAAGYAKTRAKRGSLSKEA